MIQELISAFWIFLPAGMANMAPIFAYNLPGLRNWNYPMDLFLTFRGRRVLGENKTIRGLIMGLIVGIVTALILNETWIFGLLLGAGALLGDAMKSFFKRQLDIPSGKSWLVFDQIDYILGGILFTYWYQPLSWQQYLYIILVYFVLHLLTSFVGYLVGMKKSAI